MIGCTIKQLPGSEIVAAARTAEAINPANRVSPAKVLRILAGFFVPPESLEPEHLAVMTSKYWGAGGVKLTVGFLDGPNAATKSKILAAANNWGKHCNASFVLSNTDPQVRIARTPGDGYWSYLGTDLLHIPASQQTMNLEGFTENTPDAEYLRVVQHEFGHTMGFPHEHLRAELIARLDRAKTIAYFMQTQGWTAQMTTQQVLTPVSEVSIRGTPHADQDSIMCYQLPGSITTDGQPIRGGTDIDPLDGQFAGTLYPLAVTPPVNPPVKPPIVPPITSGGFLMLIQKILALIVAIKAGDIATVLKILGELFAAQQAGQISAAEHDAAMKLLQP